MAHDIAEKALFDGQLSCALLQKKGNIRTTSVNSATPSSSDLVERAIATPSNGHDEITTEEDQYLSGFKAHHHYGITCQHLCSPSYLC